MPGTARVAPGGMVFHVLNRSVGKNPWFFDDEDHTAFERIIADTLEKGSMRIVNDCLMPNHWHFVLWPDAGGDLGRFMQRLTVTHVTRWQKHNGHAQGEATGRIQDARPRISSFVNGTR